MFNLFIFLSSKLIHLFPHFLLSLCTYVKLNCLLKMQKRREKIMIIHIFQKRILLKMWMIWTCGEGIKSGWVLCRWWKCYNDMSRKIWERLVCSTQLEKGKKCWSIWYLKFLFLLLCPFKDGERVCFSIEDVLIQRN